MNKNMKWLTKFTIIAILILSITGCGVDEVTQPIENIPPVTQEVEQDKPKVEQNKPVENVKPIEQAKPTESNLLGEPDTVNYKLIKVAGGDTSGHREPNVVVDVGYGDRKYWAYTNEHGQLIRVTAKEIILQNDDVEDVNSSGRYYHKMADVPGVGEKYGMDRGHVIADSLGGESNAYNITPQDATLNRHGDQAYMERVIRDAGGATNFDARINYPNTETQTPSDYSITYTVKGNTVTDSFPNGNPDEINKNLGLTEPAPVNKDNSDKSANNKVDIKEGDLSSVDTNGNGRVTIQEAKDAGFSMPVYKDHWLYQYMSDTNNNGMVGE